MRTTETIRTWTGAALAAAAALALAATSAAAQRSFNPSNPGVWQTDFTKHSVPFEEIFSGGVPRDGIPPIDDPQTGQIADVEAFISDTEPVITVQVNGAARAYPRCGVPETELTSPSKRCRRMRGCHSPPPS